jgi:hypothetical protein
VPIAPFRKVPWVGGSIRPFGTGPQAAPSANPSAIHSANFRVVTRRTQEAERNLGPVHAKLSAVATLSQAENALRARGLEPRGAFHPDAADGVPPLAGGRCAGTLVLAGSVGASAWAHFARERRNEPEPLDRWSARALATVAERFDATVLLPNDGPPYPPFQRWAARAGPVHRSPLGVLIHPEFGLWHAYRGALVFADRFALPLRDGRASPCDSCSDRPCLAACPVGAFTTLSYDDVACAAHLESGAGDCCFEFACLARAACPVGREHRYLTEQARFQMRAFLSGRSRL